MEKNELDIRILHFTLSLLKKNLSKNLHLEKSSPDLENRRRALSGCWMEILISLYARSFLACCRSFHRLFLVVSCSLWVVSGRFLLVLGLFRSFQVVLRFSKYLKQTQQQKWLKVYFDYKFNKRKFSFLCTWNIAIRS